MLALAMMATMMMVMMLLFGDHGDDDDDDDDGRDKGFCNCHASSATHHLAFHPPAHYRTHHRCPAMVSVMLAQYHEQGNDSRYAAVTTIQRRRLPQ